MRKPRFLRPALLGCALALAAGLASATVLGFDDIGADGPVPLAYGGLDWSAAGWTVFGTEMAPFTAHSGSYRVASGWEATDADSLVRFNAPAVFQGAWFAGLQGATVSFALFSGGQQVASSATLDPGATPVFLASGYAGLVDAVQVHSPAHASFVMDDFSFTAAVPEPQSLPLMALGLVAVAAAVRRRR
jgi:hypothetical protein